MRALGGNGGGENRRQRRHGSIHQSGQSWLDHAEDDSIRVKLGVVRSKKKVRDCLGPRLGRRALLHSDHLPLADVALHKLE